MALEPGANTLYYGDNLDVLRQHVRDESVDLIYLDPPFNSNATYNVLFRAPAGHDSESQIEAFKDTWHWGPGAALALHEVLKSSCADAAAMLVAMQRMLKQSDLMAYLCMMTVRMLELHRVLKPTGSLYLHCDATASHYLKVMLDAVFGPQQFISEIVWKRTNARSTTGKWPRLHDTILLYGKSRRAFFKAQTEIVGSVKLPHTLVIGEDGKRYQTYELTAPGLTREGESGKPWRGFDPGRWHRHWANSVATMEGWQAAGEIHWPRGGGFPRRKAAVPFIIENRVVAVGDVWTDIDRLNQTAKERLGYPTQKPLALLERILFASSNEGDIVLDPFCGCGTTVDAAEKLGRRWLGIDITHLAVSLVERRLRDAFPRIRFEVKGTPQDLDAAGDLARRDKYQFQWWAVSLVDAVPQGGQKKGADRGIDGIRWVRTGPNDGDIDQVVISVKGGDSVGVGMVRDLAGVVERERAAAGVLITLAAPTRDMRREAAAAGLFETSFGRHPKIQIYTIRDLLGRVRIDLPPLGRGEGFRRAARERGPRPTQADLDL